VRTVFNMAALACALAAVFAFGQDAAPQWRQNRARLGVMPLESLTGHDKLASEMTEVMAGKLDSMGLYNIYRPHDIDRALAGAGIRKPNNCGGPICVQNIARELGFDMMVYGTVDMNGAKCGVEIVLIDASRGWPLKRVSIEGAEGVPPSDVMRYALERMHGDKSQIGVKKYYGPKVNNAVEFVWSSAAVQGAGALYNLINYGAGGASSSADKDYKNEKYSGIPALSNRIPAFARPTALADAYTAVSDDACGVLYNPAGMPLP